MRRTTASIALLAVLLIGVIAVRYFSRPADDKPGAMESPSSGLSTSQDTHPESSPLPSPSPSIKPVIDASAADLKQLDTLNEIMKSRNDNDPRLDKDFRTLSPAAKQLFVARYHELAPEKRNERGTIVYLLGRNLTTEDDFRFLCDVLREPPCISLSNCAGDPESLAREDFDRESGGEVTAAYPQHVALESLKRYLADKRGAEGALNETALRTINCGKDSRVDSILQKANRFSQELGPRR